MTPRRRQLLALAVAVLAMVLIVAGIALIFPPAALIAAGVALIGLLTFDPTHARRLTWPR